MRSLTVIGHRWRQAAEVSLSMAVILAVAVMALTRLGTQGLIACKAPGDAERALPSGSSVRGLLSFEAPEATVAQLKANKVQSESSGNRLGHNSLFVKDWRFTQNPVVDAVAPILATNTGLDFSIVFNGSPVSLSALNSLPPLNFIAIAGALYYEWYILANVYGPAAGSLITLIDNSVAKTDPALASLLKAIQAQFSVVGVEIVNLLRSLQYLFLSLTPPNFRPPAIPPASPNT